jgi:hypothetical protein
MTSTNTVRDFSHRNVKVSHRAGIGANFSHRKVNNFHRAVNDKHFLNFEMKTKILNFEMTTKILKFEILPRMH